MSICEICKLYGEHGDQGKLKCPQFKDDRELTYSEKGNHKQRSIYHQPKHLIHWDKLNKKEKPDTVE
jgi:hypothetical protein